MIPALLLLAVFITPLGRVECRDGERRCHAVPQRGLVALWTPYATAQASDLSGRAVPWMARLELFREVTYGALARVTVYSCARVSATVETYRCDP